ncbi:MAG: DUF1700 domain-containing protein [Eubacteriales bacterium]|nr:DUF1700 domain-containing protein [Eubacteriales bacterium]
MNQKETLSREAYMKQLGRKLGKLPKEDYHTAMEYFREYFEEAGPENERQAIADLGTPEEAAHQIMEEMALKKRDIPPKRQNGFLLVGKVILGIFVVPIAALLILSGVITAAALAGSVVIVLAALVLSAAAVVLAGGICTIFSGLMLFRSPANAAATMGLSLLITGIGLLIYPGSIYLTREAVRISARGMRWIGKKVRREKRNEENR